MDRTSEDDDGRFGEATGEEGDERGRGAAVRAARPWVSWCRWCRRRQRGCRRKRGKMYEKRHNLVNEGSGDYAPLIETKRALGWDQGGR